MRSSENLERLLATMDVVVQDFGAREVTDRYAAGAAPLNAVIVHYVLSGAVVITGTGRTRRRCGSSVMILVPPGVESLLSRDGEAPAAVATALVSARLSGGFGLLDHAKSPLVEDMSDSPMIGSAWTTMVSEAAKGTQQGIGSAALTSTLMKACILTALRRFSQRPGINPRIVSALADPRLSGAIAWILREPGAGHSVAALAKAAGLSRSTFARQFSQALGLSPMDFVAKTRLHYAAGMLRSSSMPIKTIAANIGFSSRSHFSRTFRELYGHDPRAYRQRGSEAPELLASGPGRA